MSLASSPSPNNNNKSLCYFNKNNIDKQNTQNMEITLLKQMLEEKDEILMGLQKQITKYKAEHMKDCKTIKNLQQKIVQLAPNGNNTATGFMLASQFKDYFDVFLKETYSALLSPLLQFPQTYRKYSMHFLNTVYTQVDQKIQSILRNISRNLGQADDSSAILDKIKISNLKLLQDCYEGLFVENQLFVDHVVEELRIFENEEVRQIEEEEDFRTGVKDSIKICVYMLLQERVWRFVQEEKEGQFVKKQFTCIDGWIKEKGRVLFILEGIEREDTEKGWTRHQNLKNYVIPFPNDAQQIVLTIKQNSNSNKCQNQFEIKSQQTVKLCTKQVACQYQQQIQSIPAATKQIQTQPAVIILYNHQNVPPHNNSTIKEKKKSSNKNLISEKSDRMHTPQDCDAGIKKMIKQNCKNNNLKESNKNSQINQHSSFKMGTTKQHNLISDPSFEEIMNLPKGRNKSNKENKQGKQNKENNEFNDQMKQKNNYHKDFKKNKEKIRIDQLPLRRDNQSKGKKSRKSSIGKIIGQNISEIRGKQKQNSRLSNKEMAYKEMIRSKFVDENLINNQTKTERVTKQQHQQHSMEQDRPLRMMQMKKIRDKYLNL